MIPGLEISEEAEERIWSAFERWSTRFKSKLAEKGVPHLIDRYQRLVESVETQSCFHGPGDSVQTGYAWQYCCGLRDKFAADVQCRDALRVIEEVVPPEAASQLRQEIAALDERLYALFDNPPARTGAWWNEAYPRGIINPGPLDLVGTWVTEPSKKHGRAVDELCLREDRTFTARCGHQGGPLQGHGTWAPAAGGTLEFTIGARTVSVRHWYRVDELLLYFGEARVVRYLRRE
jgi:hypothetical protein